MMPPGTRPRRMRRYEAINHTVSLRHETDDALRQIIAPSPSTSTAFPRSAAFDPNYMSFVASTGPILGFMSSTYAGPTSKAALDPLMISLDLWVSRHPT
ncbi:hypothetical protein L3X38_033563 [Prunus dulcis]|uniref:Uncharacterized protein n=1 Tax=Prunus dulcis TaxID=3755 RepID=A0AAD4YX16_PRUDU|nr:hypothetical protein L3X38_033563 [Prunus dulcis]